MKVGVPEVAGLPVRVPPELALDVGAWQTESRPWGRLCHSSRLGFVGAAYLQNYRGVGDAQGRAGMLRGESVTVFTSSVVLLMILTSADSV